MKHVIDIKKIYNNFGRKTMKAILWKISLPVVFLFLFMFTLIPLAAKAQPPEGTRPENIITAEPVHGVTVGPGKKLWVFVFPAKGGNGGGRKPPKDEQQNEQPSCPGQCDDDDLNVGFAKLGFKIPSEGLAFDINENSIPNDTSAAVDAILESFNAWESAGNVPLSSFSYPSDAASMPAADGRDTIGWVRIVPRSTLAATWVWTQDGIVVDVDIFYNRFHEWGTLNCGDDIFDIQNVGTHEVGHVIGLGHVSDDCKTATMYPSAPKGEVKKRTLTIGDTDGVNALYPSN